MPFALINNLASDILLIIYISTIIYNLNIIQHKNEAITSF